MERDADSVESIDLSSFKNYEDQKVDPAVLDKIYNIKKSPHSSDQIEEDRNIERLKYDETQFEKVVTTLNTRLQPDKKISIDVKIENIEPSTSSLTVSSNISSDASSNKTVFENNDRPSRKKSLICTICQEILTENNIVEHMRSHTDAKPFSCDICKKTFATKSQVVAHMLTHVSKCVPFDCNLCHKRYSHKSKLTHHMISHPSCKICKKKCKNRSSLMIHMRTHSGEKHTLALFAK